MKEEIKKFNDPTGILPFEHRITYSVKKPKHKKYNLAEVSFCFEPNKKTLKRLDFLVDDKLFYVNLALGTGQVSSVWLFQKKDSLHKIADADVDLMLCVASDAMKSYPKMHISFLRLIAVLPRQAKIYKRLFDKSKLKQEKKLLLTSLREKNNLIHNVQKYYRKMVENKNLEMGVE